MKEKLQQLGAKYSFSATAFNPFFANLYQTRTGGDLLDNKLLAPLRTRFINQTDNGVQVFAFFPDEIQLVRRMQQAVAGIPGVEILSPGAFGRDISRFILRDAKIIAGLAVGLVVILAFLCLRQWRDALSSLLPVLGAIAAIVVFFALIYGSVNVIGIVAGIVVVGLAIDYGIFAVICCRGQDLEMARGTSQALALSMLSSVIGAACLLWARHQALQTVGTVLTVGIISAYLTAVLVVPQFYAILGKAKIPAKQQPE